MTQGKALDGKQRASTLPRKIVKPGPGADSKLEMIDMEKVYALRPDENGENGYNWNEIAAYLHVSPKALKNARIKYEAQKKEKEAQAVEPVNNIVEPELSPEIERAPEKPRKATKPWNAGSNPWSLDLLRVRNRRPGYGIRWINVRDIQKYLDQGAWLAQRKHYQGLTDNIIGEAEDNQTLVKRREMVLIEFTNEWAEQRKAFMAHKTDQRSQSSSQIAERQAIALKKKTGTDKSVLNIQEKNI